MIVASALLVVVAAVTLGIGFFNPDMDQWIYGSIASCLVAALLLVVGSRRTRPRRKPVLQSGGDGQPASWAGAASWGGAATAGDRSSDTAVLERDEEPAFAPPARRGDDTSAWAPTRDEPATDETGPVPQPTAPTEQEAPAAPPDDDDVVVVPKRSARTAAAPRPRPAAKRAPAPRKAATRPAPAPRKTAARPAKTAEPAAGADATADAATTAATAPAPATPRPAAGAGEAARFEAALAPIPGVGPAKRAQLLEHFGTFRRLKAASVDKLAEVPGISVNLAQRIHSGLRG